MTNNEPVIKVRKLKIAFGSKVVLDEIDLDLYPGETLAVIGPSGTGKSTVLKVMTGLLKPTSGSVIIQGQETNGFDESQWDELRKHMGVVFQYSALFDFLTVGENVAFGLRRHFNLPEAEIPTREKHYFVTRLQCSFIMVRSAPQKRKQKRSVRSLKALSLWV